jgi:hypothetical protein
VEEIHLGAWLILGTQGFTLLGAIATFVMALRSKKVADENKRAVQELTINVDGRLSQFMELIKVSSHAEGKLEGVAEEKANTEIRS